MQVAFIGSGNVARALGALMQAAGHEVVYGTREGLAPAGGRAVTMEEAATRGEVVILAVPFAATRELLAPLAGKLAGKLVVDATNPVNADWSPLLLGQENSAGEEIARMLPASRVVKAFNTVFADVMRPERLVREGQRVTCFIASDDTEAAGRVLELARGAGFAPRLVGPLKMARHLESLAHLNIQLAVGMKGGTNAAFLYQQVSG